MNPLQNKNIVLGIAGSIAAYKAAEIASALTKQGAKINPVLTPAGEKFISPLTLHSVTGSHASVDRDLWEGDQHVTHIGLGHHADLILIAPASADFMAKIANGFGDSLLALTVLASHCPILVAPAMDGDMYSSASTQSNLSILKERGIKIIGPAAGHLASGLTGLGRMSDPDEIIRAVRYELSRGGPLEGQKIVVTAGGTQEAIDPVRVITNRSSGKQGYAVAQAALDAGAEVTLITAPTALAFPYGCEVVQVRSAAEMHQTVTDQVKEASALIMAAAVADFRPLLSADEKIKKESGFQSIGLEATEDILKSVGLNRNNYTKLKAIVGFAAESENLLKNARIKLQAKNLDLIFANDISQKDSGFESAQNQGTLLFRDGKRKNLPLSSKSEIAAAIIEEVILIFDKFA